MLFNPSFVDQNNTSPQRYNERDFEYLQRSGRPEAANIRALLETWFVDYPDEHKKDLYKRMIAREPDFLSPFFELMLHALFRTVGAEIFVHPKVSENSDKRPDFLIRLSNDFEFYLEAVLARGQSDKESKHQATLREVYDIINRNLESPEYLWEVTVLEHGHAPISGKQIVYEIGKFRKGISYSEVMEQCQKHGLNKTPIRYIFEQGGWRLEFIPIPKKEECIGKSNHRPLGVFSMPKVVRCKDDDDIRKAVNSKVKHHSIDGKPYIIAVNACNRSAQSEDFMDALYGSGVLNITTYSYGSHQLKFTRACDGVWLDKRGHPKNSNLIAVLGVRKLTPWTIESASLIAFENPYISYPPKARIAGLPRYEVADGMLNFVEGKTLGQLFKLPWEWP